MDLQLLFQIIYFVICKIFIKRYDKRIYTNYVYVIY
jgi:hypothetical protein